LRSRFEVVLVDGEGLRLLERGHRRRPPRKVSDERHLAKALTRPAHRENGRVAKRRHDPDREPAGGDEVERVPGVVVVKDDLVPCEPAPARDRDQSPDVGLREPGQQPPLHRSIVRRLPCDLRVARHCRRRHSSSVFAGNDAAARRSYRRDETKYS
jgi:hypothetical protein